MDQQIKDLDYALDGFETPEFGAIVMLASGLNVAVSITKNHPMWLNARRLLAKEKGLSPVVLDRLKQYVLIKTIPNVEHPQDAAALASLLLLDDVYGQDSPEFRASIALAKHISNPWWSWQWVLSTQTNLTTTK